MHSSIEDSNDCPAIVAIRKQEQQEDRVYRVLAIIGITLTVVSATTVLAVLILQAIIR